MNIDEIFAFEMRPTYSAMCVVFPQGKPGTWKINLFQPIVLVFVQ